MADIYNEPIILSIGVEQECFGAIILAGFGVGLYKDVAQTSEKLISVIDKVKPDRETSQKYERLFQV